MSAPLPTYPIGTRFGFLEVISERRVVIRWKSNNRLAAYECRCDCGGVVVALASLLNGGKHTSCGCRLPTKGKNCPLYRHGYSAERLNLIWRNMHSRCYNTGDINFSNYGARGIAICKNWHDYANFREWALKSGYDPRLTIERKDNDGIYEPENCCWITRREQAKNRTTTVLLTAWGETKCMSDWLRDPRCAVKESSLATRLKKGCSHEEAIGLPPHPFNRKRSSWK